MQQAGSGPFSEVDTSHLWPLPPNTGLATVLSSPDPNRRNRRIDLFVGAGALNPPAGTFMGGSLPASEVTKTLEFLPLAPLAGGGDRIRWQGQVYAEGGDYKMELRTDASAKLLIDNQSVVTQCNTNPDNPGYEIVTGTCTWTGRLAPGPTRLPGHGKDNG